MVSFNKDHYDIYRLGTGMCDADTKPLKSFNSVSFWWLSYTTLNKAEINCSLGCSFKRKKQFRSNSISQFNTHNALQGKFIGSKKNWHQENP